MSTKKELQLLLVEDDRPLGEATKAILSQYGFDVIWATDGEIALNHIESKSIDIIILDLGIPRIKGLDLLKYIREKQIDTPVIILTALGSLQDRINGLDAGADDYLIKPFDSDELLARIRALSRRIVIEEAQMICYQDIELNLESLTLKVKDKRVEVAKREFEILKYLLENQGRVLSRDRLGQLVYGWGNDSESNTLEVHVHNLRKKIGSDIIKTVRGVGYIIEKN